MKFINLTGFRFGKLTALSAVKNKWGSFSWQCRCRCGGNTIALGADLRKGHTTSCGCIRTAKLVARSLTHGNTTGRSPTSEYKTWCAMKGRCYRASDKRFKDYGGRGIKVCAKWRKSFSAFLKDMGKRPNRMTLERKNNDGNYEPVNCVWATRKAQANNNRHNKRLTYQGNTLTVSQWADKLDIPSTTLYQRIHRQWDTERILTP